MFDAYIEAFQRSEIPVPFWGLLLIWAGCFLANHLIYLRTRALSKAQTMVTAADAPNIEKYGVKLVVRQVLFSLLLFAVAFAIGPPAYALIAGGWVIAAAVSAGVNLNSMLFSRALNVPGAAEGSVKLSAPLALRARAAQLFGGVALCIGICALVPHLSLLGAAIFLGATAYGYERKAKQIAHP